ncbi:hypothetical protein Tcan_16121 [Toxocara canis]|uniref:Uncharacterized protein n=1 Tax=Toxocara canis TaxID=6265 RepID=A0A0B2VTE7_TOXCA|nr:hypothetical protein Tcan_16121 [Toxocara canis]
MEDGKIVLIGNETDILHCGYSHALRDGDKRFGVRGPNDTALRYFSQYAHGGAHEQMRIN